MSTPHHTDLATAAASIGGPPAHGLRFVPPETSGWPTRWPRPTPADLEDLEAQYRLGFLPAHAPLLRRRVPPLQAGTPECHQVARALLQAVRAQADAGAGITVGLAAPQLGMATRAILFDPRPEVTGPPAVEELRCVINPTVEPVGDGQTRDVEGCLSTGTVRGWVPRAMRVRLVATTPDGDPVDEQHVGHAARVLQHESDHLEGIRFPERVTDGELLWASAEQGEAFLTYVRATRRGEATRWETIAPRDQWQAAHGGLAIFGTLSDQGQR